MSRIHGLTAAYLLITLACLCAGASATPITGSGAVIAHSFITNGGKVYNSSLSGAGSAQSHMSFSTGNSGSFAGMRPHQFSLQVPPPSETPEPSTLLLFGSGLMMVGAAVRRQFGR